MRPFGYRRILRAAATTILLAVPAARAGQVTADLGTVGYSIGIDASITNTDHPSNTETCTYQQLIFEGPLSMVIDRSGDTLAYLQRKTWAMRITGHWITIFLLRRLQAGGSRLVGELN